MSGYQAVADSPTPLRRSTSVPLRLRLSGFFGGGVAAADPASSAGVAAAAPLSSDAAETAPLAAEPAPTTTSSATSSAHSTPHNTVRRHPRTSQQGNVSDNASETTNSDDSNSLHLSPSTSLLYMRGPHKDIDSLLRLGHDTYHHPNHYSGTAPEVPFSTLFDGFHLQRNDETAAVLLVNRSTADIDRFLQIAEERLATSIEQRRVSMPESQVAQLAQLRLKNGKPPHSDIDHLLSLGGRTPGAAPAAGDAEVDAILQAQIEVASQTSLTSNASTVSVCMITIAPMPRDVDDVVHVGDEPVADPVFADVQELISLGEFGSLKQLPHLVPSDAGVLSAEGSASQDLDSLIKIGEDTAAAAADAATASDQRKPATAADGSKQRKARRHTVSGSKPVVETSLKPGVVSPTSRSPIAPPSPVPDKLSSPPNEPATLRRKNSRSRLSTTFGRSLRAPSNRSSVASSPVQSTENGRVMSLPSAISQDDIDAIVRIGGEAAETRVATAAAAAQQSGQLPNETSLSRKRSLSLNRLARPKPRPGEFAKSADNLVAGAGEENSPLVAVSAENVNVTVAATVEPLMAPKTLSRTRKTERPRSIAGTLFGGSSPDLRNMLRMQQSPSVVLAKDDKLESIDIDSLVGMGSS